MRHRWGYLLWLALVSILLAGCASAGASISGAAAGANQAVEVTDDAGRTVKLDRPATRIVSLAPSNTELIFAVGAGDKVVGVDDYSDYPAEAKSREKVGGFSKTNVEKVLSLGPDLVLATSIHEKEIVPELQRRGLAVAILQPKKIDGVADNVRLMGKLTGKGPESEALANELRRRLEAVVAKAQTAKSRPRVYFELAADLFTVGPGSFVDDMITKAGGQNIAADAKTQWPQLNVEAVLTKDPEVIILSDYGQADAPERVKARPGWQALSAAKSGRIFKMNADLLNRPSPRAIDGLEELARTLQPELFR